MGRDLIETGVYGLDNLLGGGIPRGNLILVEGPIGAGKTTLGLEFIYRGATRYGEPGLVVLFELTPEKVVRDAREFGWDLAELERQGKLKLIFTTREMLRQELQEPDSLLLEQARKLGARRIFLDGVARLVPREGFSVAAAAEDVRSAFHLMAEAMVRERFTAMVAVEAGLDGGTTEPGQNVLAVAERAIADTVIQLGRIEKNRATSRSLQIVKSRGQDYHMGQHSFRIVDGVGVEVFRRVQAPRALRPDRAYAFDPDHRAATGTPGLDELVNGGYYRGSTTVVVGVSGAGKSVLALQYLAEGARQSERSLMLSLDERVEQIERNAASIGIDLVAHEAQGLTRIEFAPPQEVEVDEHYHHIESLIEEFRPQRVVIDSLSTYLSVLGKGERVFRDFFHALVALMKEYQISAVYNHEVQEMLGMGSMTGGFGLSSLVDNILLLNWVEIGDQFRLGLTVAKMRANPVNRTTRECEIVAGKGFRVLPREMPLGSETVPFSHYAGLVSRAPVRRERTLP